MEGENSSVLEKIAKTATPFGIGLMAYPVVISAFVRITYPEDFSKMDHTANIYSLMIGAGMLLASQAYLDYRKRVKSCYETLDEEQARLRK